MKQLLPVLLIVSCFSLNAQPIDWDAVIDRYAEKYQPEQIPAWLFPIIFKDATGAMDTIYFGYDEGASPAIPVDTTFGETYVFADSFQFNAYWAKCPPSLCDDLEILDIAITGDGFSSVSYNLKFRNGLLPVTMYFDATFLSADVLPLPDQTPNPKAQINIKNGWPLSAWSDPDHTFPCDYHEHLLITDNSLMGEFCVYSDSIEFIADPDIIDWMQGFSFKLLPWTGLNPVSNKEIENHLAPKIYPNPVKDIVTFETAVPITANITLYDLSGNRVFKDFIDNLSSYQFSTIGLSPGLYFLKIESETFVFTEKIGVIR